MTIIRAFLKKYFYLGQKKWFYAKFLSRKNLLIIFISLNGLLYLITYSFFVSDLLKEISAIKQKTQVKTIDNSTIVNFKTKVEKLTKNLDNPKFLALKKLSAKSIELSIKNALEQSPGLKNHRLTMNRSSEDTTSLTIFTEGNWQSFSGFLQEIEFIKFRFFVKDFDIYTDKTHKKVSFKLEIEDILPKILASQKLNSQHRLEEIYYAENLDEQKLGEPLNFADFTELLNEFTSLDTNFLIPKKQELANPFASKLKYSLIKNYENQKNKTHLDKSIRDKTSSYSAKNLTLVGIISSTNKIQVIIKVAEGQFQTLNQGDFIKNTQFKLVKISAKKSRAEFFNRITKKTIILTAN